jgi:hypothetical protein
MRRLSHRLAVPSPVPFTLVAVLLALLGAVPTAAQHDASSHATAHSDPHGGTDYGDNLGEVRLPDSCEGEETDRHLSRGLALLHHMTYEGARAEFAAAAEADPGCALAAWGQAMTYIHPLWSDPPGEEDFEHARALLAEAREMEGASESERAYLDAAWAYYAEGRSTSEKPNLAAFAAAWRGVHERRPEDPEAAALHALSHLATADPADKSYAVQREAGAVAEAILGDIPDHPGGHHYIIHAYDYPALAEEALPAARHYGEIAPAVPHALHMPSHIFTRRGLWQDSIEWNERSADAAAEHRVNGALSLHHLHALDYLAYAHLQRGEDEAAEAVGRRLDALEGPYQVHLASTYTLAAVPARLALERQRWTEAAALEPRRPADYPWDQTPAMEAITHFARALGAARSGEPEKARASVEKFAALRDAAAGTSPFRFRRKSRRPRRLLCRRTALEIHPRNGEKGALQFLRRGEFFLRPLSKTVLRHLENQKPSRPRRRCGLVQGWLELDETLRWANFRRR